MTELFVTKWLRKCWQSFCFPATNPCKGNCCHFAFKFNIKKICENYCWNMWKLWLEHVPTIVFDEKSDFRFLKTFPYRFPRQTKMWKLWLEHVPTIVFTFWSSLKSASLKGFQSFFFLEILDHWKCNLFFQDEWP